MTYPLHNMPDLEVADLPQPAHFLPTLRMRPPSGHPAASQHMPQPFGLSSQPSTYAQRDVGSAGDGYSTSPIGPPVRPRKPKAATLRPRDWAPYKERILELYEKETLSEVKRIIAKKSGDIFNPEIRQYQTRIRQWKKNKNVQPKEMKAIMRKLQKRRLVETDKGPLEFHVRGKQVVLEKIARWMKNQGLSDSLPYAPSPAASTPSAVGCHTISEPGSPVVFSALSPVAWNASPGIPVPASHSPQISSPALSISSIIQPQLSAFAGQSPSFASRSIIPFRDDYALDPAIKENERGIVVQTRYKADGEELLRDQIYMAEISMDVKPSVVFEMLDSLAHLLVSQGRYKAAEPIVYGLVLRYRRQSGVGDNEFLELSALHLLGMLLFHQGSYHKAEIILRRVKKRREMILGSQNPHTLLSRNILSRTLVKKGNYHEAETLARETLSLATKVFSFDHEHISFHVGALSEALAYRNSYEEAEIIAREIVKSDEKLQGIEHAQILSNMGILATILYEQGKYEDSYTMYVDMLASSTRVLGPEHPDTLAIKHNIADLLDREGNHEEAEAMYKEVLASKAKAMKFEHPDTLATKHNLAACLTNQDRDNEAEALLREVVSAGDRLLGLDHPDTLTTKHSLAMALRRQYKYGEAEALFKEVVSSSKRILESNHPDTLLAVQDLRLLLWEQGRHEEALKIE